MLLEPSPHGLPMRTLWASAVGGLVALGCVPEDRPSSPAPSTQPSTQAPPHSADSRPRGERSYQLVPRPRLDPSAKGPPAARLSPAASGDVPSPRLVRPFIDDFQRNRIGKNYRATSTAWTLDEGRLCGENAKNHPIWLSRRLPERVRVEFDAVSADPDGDIKVEIFGDGRSHASGTTYDNATSYLLIYGGWKNSRHVLARLNEHGADRRTTLVAPGTSRHKSPVEPGTTYHFLVERVDDATLKWSVDGQEIHRYKDEQPLGGPGHEYFAFNGWRARVCFDNLKVVPLGT